MSDPGPQLSLGSATGRDLAGSGSAFGGDDGSVPAAVGDVLARRACGDASMPEVVAVLARHRLLVPLLEVDGELLEGDDADPCAGQDRAVAAVSMRTSDGVVGLAFTGLARLLDWDPRARPMPSDAPRVAAAVIAEGGIGLLVDPASDARCRIDGQALRRLAAGGRWPQPWVDPVVTQAVVAELAPALVAGELAIRLAPPGESGDKDGAADQVDAAPATAPAPGLVVELRFPPGTPAEVAAQRAAAIADRLAGSAGLRAVFDGVLGIRVLAPVVRLPGR